MAKYATKTSVAASHSREEIERILERYGADQFLYGWDAARAVIGFRIAGRQMKILLPLPLKNAQEFWRTPGRGCQRTQEQALVYWEQACRQRWRALSLVIKAKLEAVECGISTIESEFLSSVMLPGGETVGEWIEPQIEASCAYNRMPELLPGLADTPYAKRITD